jgi:hypothetical protein
MIHEIIAAFFRPSGPYLYVRLVTAAYALSAIGRLIPVKRKQVPGYRPRLPAIAPARGTARHRARPGSGGTATEREKRFDRQRSVQRREAGPRRLGQAERTKDLASLRRRLP